jgi:hypothetical protein
MFSANTTQVSSAVNYIEDVFSTYLYTGNGTSQTITNGIDLSTKGGLVWAKARSRAGDNHELRDTVRGGDSRINSNTTNAASSTPNPYTYNTNGYTIGGDGGNTNENNITYASWTFREQPKFFDVVTYTGNGTSGRNISHNLASTPGCIIIKRTDTTGYWSVGHRGVTSDTYLYALNSTAAGTTTTNTAGVSANGFVYLPDSTSSTFNVRTGATDISAVNASGGTYVAYLFAHDAGGFGLTGTDNVISCGSYTGNGSGIGPIVTLGYEPQWIMVKPATVADNWTIVDNMRAMVAGGQSDSKLFPNSTGAETNTTAMSPEATGFQIKSISAEYNTNGATYIYIAIRRGPMKTPTTGTSVFQPVAYTGTNVDNRLVNTGIVTDMAMARIRTASSTGGFYTADRLRGNGFLGTAITDAENTDPDSFMTPTVGYGNSFSAMNGFGVGNDVTRQLNQSSTSQLAYAFQRAPSFFDEVCYTGDGGTGTRSIAHNLGAAPALMFVKSRSSGSYNWMTYCVEFGTSPSGTYGTRAIDYRAFLNLDSAKSLDEEAWGTSSAYPTSTVFTVKKNNGALNSSGITYVAYLFASCPGVSKVFNYTGNGSSQTINCGFTAGARWILIKRTDSTGDWYVWDSAGGIVSGNDPHLSLNTTAAEVTTDDTIDTDSTGFVVNQVSATNVNVSSATYIGIAIA